MFSLQLIIDKKYLLKKKYMRISIFSILFLSFTLFFTTSKAQHFPDSLKNVLKLWKLSDKNIPEYLKEDTVKDMFHIFKEYQKNSISTSHLGNIGTANISDVFIKRPDLYNIDFDFFYPYILYLTQAEDVIYVNTRKPYTNIFYSTGSKVKDEQTIDFLHSQNVHPNLNFAFNYKLVGSKGEYLFQETKINTITFQTNYQRKRYKLHAAFIYNKFKIQNNGGVKDTGNIEIGELNPFISNAGTQLYNREFYLNQKYIFGRYKKKMLKDTIIDVLQPAVSLCHIYNFKKQYRVYKDEEDTTKLKDDIYYENYFYDYRATYDSTSLYTLENSIKFAAEERFIAKYKFNFNITFTNQFKKYYYFKEYIFIPENFHYSDNKISGLIGKGIKKISMSVFGNYYLTGYRTGDYRAGAIIKRMFNDSTADNISIMVRQTNKKPGYYIQNYYSNHFRWENNFANRKTLDVSFKINLPSKYFEIGADYIILDNYINFFDTVTNEPIEVNNPSLMQFDKSIVIFSANISKRINIGRFHSLTKFTWQNSSNAELISIPKIIAYNSTYVSLNYKTHLKIDIGFDLYFTSKFRANSFNPALGHFYFENDAYTGNYPFGSVFLNAKIKKNVLIFLKYEHINSGLLKPYYITVAHYPMNTRMLKIGVNWRFAN